MTDRLLQPGLWSPDNWVALAIALGVPLAKAAVLVILTWALARLARSSFVFATERSGADAHIRLIVGRTVSVIIFILGGITILDTLGVPPATLVTVVGVVGIGISLALQDILKNFFAGTYLLFERPFRIGDEISVKDQRGIVENIGVRTTRLRTEQNVLVGIPNAVVFSEMVLNRTNERKPTDLRVAADNERAAAPAHGSAVLPADRPGAGHERGDGSAAERIGRARSALGSLVTVPVSASALVGRFALWRPVTRGVMLSALAAARNARLPGRPGTDGASVRSVGWLSRLRSRS